MQPYYKYLVKLIIVGDSCAGKSTLMYRFLYNKFVHTIESTICVEFASKIIEVNSEMMKLQIWDTGGQEKYHSITRSYFRGAAACILVYDITSHFSFENNKRWIRTVREMSSCEHTQIILVGTKNDLEDKRVISTAEGQAFADDYGIPFFETNSKESVSNIFQHLGELIYNKKELIGINQDTGIKLNERPLPPPPRKCAPC